VDRKRESGYSWAFSIPHAEAACMHPDYLPLTILFLLAILTVFWQFRQQWLWSHSFTQLETPKTKIPRPLKPKTADDCPACRMQKTALCPEIGKPAPPRPWSEVKSRRGRKKTIPTHGYACSNRECDYHRIRDAAVHALVGFGCPSHYSSHLDGWKPLATISLAVVGFWLAWELHAWGGADTLTAIALLLLWPDIRFLVAVLAIHLVVIVSLQIARWKQFHNSGSIQWIPGIPLLMISTFSYLLWSYMQNYCF
jgi:hypothetical protein